MLGAKLACISREGFMRINLIVAAVVLAAIGVALAAVVLAVSGVAPASAAGCSLGAAKAWKPFKGPSYSSEAYSNGATCAGAVVTIVVRAPGGDVLWVEAMPAAHLMTFADAKNVKRMKAGIVDWLAQPHMFKSTGDLPDWKKGTDAPVAGEFPFYPEAGVDQESYAKIRTDRLAVFCYVQGMESMACVAIAKDGSASKIGVQTFPG